ncbi:NAD(P)/FAD-dependent oxidoreductase [Kutzneria sp. CA-103260]|uniref:NAD(P)/FAD-dependent oxidoreductase n=1 Tax=Kutzneria sp. CA-103260 TaxID=2802641 RepID=UPI001BA86725|nr:NAD(P)/FAD-dependent oxidoreductase [Kutzneria sp. CA-103260]QUQ68863.1 NADH dehydrogenase [Kutzneria sp. CA-103260]
MGATEAEPRTRVLILGGGFAGIGVARKLRKADVDVVIVDEHDYHTFQPLLYQVATDLLPRTTVGHPLRDLFDHQSNARVHTACVTSVNLEKREVEFAEMGPLGYDYLVLALGAQVNFFGVEHAADHAFPLYTLADAVRLKEHILDRWEAADKDPALVEDGALNVVVVGGGPTGVESAGAIAELYRAIFVTDYPDIPQENAEIVLVEAGPEIFAMFHPSLRRYAEKALARRSVEVLTGEIVESVTPTRVALKSGRVIPSHTLVWGAGLQANAVVEVLGLELQKGRRILVQPDLSVAGHPEVFAIGDIAWITDAKTGKVLPQLGSVALESGHHAGDNIARLVKGVKAEPFKYFDKGTMATIGRGAAVIQGPRGLTMKGKAAWLTWGAVHLALLSTGEDRAKAVVDWTWAAFTHGRSTRITVRTDAT